MLFLYSVFAGSCRLLLLRLAVRKQFRYFCPSFWDFWRVCWLAQFCPVCPAPAWEQKLGRLGIAWCFLPVPALRIFVVERQRGSVVAAVSVMSRWVAPSLRGQQDDMHRGSRLPFLCAFHFNSIESRKELSPHIAVPILGTPYYASELLVL